ncbi:MAG: PAS domain S-box protein, partial [Deltaproteobacteria bacterium]|nr:PAS domain S-box protein [Deltaproteobacteria bacterium]
KYEYGIKPSDILKRVLMVAGSASLILLLFLFWNRSLAKKVRERTSELTSSHKLLKAEIVERKGAEERLREGHDYLKRLTDSMGDTVFSITMPERVIEWVNDSLRMLGYDPDDCVGKTTEFLYPDKAKYLAFGDILAEFIAEDDRDILHLEQMYKKKGGELFPAELTITKEKVNKEVVSLTAIARDISERKKAEHELKRYQKRLKALASQLTLAQENERRHIAIQLHDHIGQTLAFSRIQVARAKKYEPEGKLATILDEISQSLLTTIQDTKGLIFDLSPPLLHEIGLASAISNWLEDQVGRKNSIRVDFIYSGNELSLENDTRSLLFRNVRELLCNVIKHAQATEVIVSLVNNEEELVIIVRDDGIGFEHDDTTYLVGIDSGFGLFSVKQQIEGLGGELEIVSKPGKGCKATLTVPMNT